MANISSEMTIYENPTEKNKFVAGIKQGGIDNVDLQKKLYEAEMTKVASDVKNISKDSLKIKALTQLQTYVQNFQNINNNLTNKSGISGTLLNVFNDYIAGMSPVQGIDAKTYLSASANPGSKVDETSYLLQVTQLAAKDLIQSTPVVGWAGALGLTGTININTSNYAGSSISVSASDDLSMIIEKINQKSGLTGVIAEQTTPSVGGNPIIILRGENTADPITITESLQDSITTNPAGLLLSTPTLPSTSTTRTGSLSTLQCQFTVDGVSYLRNTNEVTDAINGVSFIANAVMPAATTLTFNVNTQKIYDLMNSWIESFNTIKTFLKNQSTPTEGEDPNGEHVLLNSPIVKKTCEMLNQIKSTVLGVYDKWDASIASGRSSTGEDNDVGNLQSLGIKLATAMDPFSGLIFEQDTLLKRINQNPQNIQKLMGQFFTCSDSNLILNDIPSIFSSTMAGKNLTLTIQNYNSLTATFDAVLTDGTTSETVTGISSFTKNINFTQAYSGFKFLYNAPISGTTSANFTVTKGVASTLNSSINSYLQTPIDINRYENYPSDNVSENFGDLSSSIYEVIQDKKSLKKKIDKVEKVAKETYERNIKKGQENNKIFNNMQAVRAMINRLDNNKG